VRASRQVAVASTGQIALELPVQRVLDGIPAAIAGLRAEGAGDFQRAIQTTDAFEKRASLTVSLPSGVVSMSAQCKGAGMISPRFATMLCFVETDAALEPETADLLLGVCVKRSFDRITVDGQLSTNDVALLICSGRSGVLVAPESEDELRFGEALDALLRQLALMIVADGEGTKRVGRVLVRGGERDAVESVARGVANSPLVKTALHGADPNWGRLVQAVGAALAGAAGEEPAHLGLAGEGPVDLGLAGEEPAHLGLAGESSADRGPGEGEPAHLGGVAVDLVIEGMKVCAGGAAIDYDEELLARAVQRDEVEYEILLPGQGAEAEVFFADLGHGYVTINAEYTT
jgi:glutamate N-acetyltransferase/amino-acid N-acetyltransferase